MTCVNSSNSSSSRSRRHLRLSVFGPAESLADTASALLAAHIVAPAAAANFDFDRLAEDVALVGRCVVVAVGI